jgi:hypothetical protein
VGGAPRPRRLAQLGAERGAADPRRPGVACLPGASTFVNLSLSCSIIFAFVFAARRSLVFVCWRQELELRARDRYGTFDQMITELRQLQEQRDTSTPSSRP